MGGRCVRAGVGLVQVVNDVVDVPPPQAMIMPGNMMYIPAVNLVQDEEEVKYLKKRILFNEEGSQCWQGTVFKLNAVGQKVYN